MMEGRCAFMPVEATLAPGPYTPPARSDSRVAVNGSARPPGGPERKFAIAATRVNIFYDGGVNERDIPCSAAFSYQYMALWQLSLVPIPLQ